MRIDWFSVASIAAAGVIFAASGSLTVLFLVLLYRWVL